MKRIILMASIMGLGLFSSSCDKEQDQLRSENDIAKKRLYIYWAVWDEAGRASKQCDGWGLCNFEDCWFCERQGLHTPDAGGEIKLDDVQDVYTLTIKLDITNTEDAAGISSQLPLVVDYDIVDEALPEEWNTITIQAGSYPFDGSVGDNGGYIIPLIMD